MARFQLELRLLGFQRARAHALAGAPNRLIAPIGALPAVRIAELLASAARWAWPAPKCLTRSLALTWILRGAGVQAELRIGARVRDGGLEAHAWVESGGIPVNDTPEHILGFPELRASTGAS